MRNKFVRQIESCQQTKYFVKQFMFTIIVVNGLKIIYRAK